MKAPPARKWLAPMIGVLFAFGASAQEATTNAQSASPLTAIQKGGTEAEKPAAPKVSPAVDEVRKMLAVGVSKEVVRTYVEHSPTAFQLTANDLIALKEQGVPDEITTAMLKRSAELEESAAAARASARATLANAERRFARSQVLDPEGYDFWWYHYAYPRALASANARLLSSYGPVTPSYPFGWYPPLPLAPRPLSQFSRP